LFKEGLELLIRSAIGIAEGWLFELSIDKANHRAGLVGKIWSIFNLFKTLDLESECKE
jgi:hypothetical protein